MTDRFLEKILLFGMTFFQSLLSSPQNPLIVTDVAILFHAKHLN